MKDIVIFGAGGFGREVQWLIERINEKSQEWNILGYIDDHIKEEVDIDGYSVIGDTKWLLSRNVETAVVCAVGNAHIRKKIIEKIEGNCYLSFPNLIDPAVHISKRIKFGKGNIICAGTIATVDIVFGDFDIINLDCTIGHDVVLDSYITLYPGVNISGNVTIANCSEIGTGTRIIQGKKIAAEVILGAGSVVVKDILESGTYAGVPIKKLKNKN